MIVENRGQQQSIRFIVDTERCSGCRRCIRRCMENVWHWDKENKYAYPKYPDECVLCHQCEMECVNNCIVIDPISTLQVDPLCYSAGMPDEANGGN